MNPGSAQYWFVWIEKNTKPMGLIDITKNHQIWLNLQVQRHMPKQGLSKKLQGLFLPAKLKLESNIFRMEGQNQKQC